MTLYYGKRSEACLETTSLAIQHLMRQVLALGLIDVSIVCGHRGRAEQDEAFNSGASKVRWPNSKHNDIPSEAFDAYPFIRGKISYNYNHCCFLAGIILSVSLKISVPVRWGGNWDSDLEIITDQKFQDLGHYETVPKIYVDPVVDTTDGFWRVGR